MGAPCHQHTDPFAVMVATDVLVLRETEVEAVHTSEGDEEEPRSPLSHGGDNTAGGVHDKVDGII